ncbi:hypothetical protein [Xanthomonas sp. SI]|uniref:hypothetical protein n=1 Tax=Xanthomonas sp. SI TaxID=2724123 RepID=UPI001639CB6C|nr:hypothetical protein [Xanthomonas sp. SI]
MLERSLAIALSEIQPGLQGAEHIPGYLADLSLASSVLVSSSNLSFELVKSEARRLRTDSRLEAALQQSSDAHAVALKKAGLAPTVLDILKSWVEVQVEGRVLQRQLDFDRLVSRVADVKPTGVFPISGRDASKFLSAVEFARELGISDETVRRREDEREVFSILRPGRKRGREYPAFQAWPGIVGAPLTQVLAALDPELGSATYGFFVSPNELLYDLTPVELLCGALLSVRDLSAGGADQLMASAPAARLEAVIGAANAYVLGP